MFIVSVAYCLLLVSDATLVLDINTTVGESMILPCIQIPATADLKNLRFYWQDEGQLVLYSFNKGKEMPEHVNERYRGRTTAFPQDIIRGNISVKLQNVKVEEDQKVFYAFAAVLDKMDGYILQLAEICQIILHVAVPFESISLSLNEDTRTAVCSAQRGFPKPSVQWTLQNLSDSSELFLDSKYVHTTAEPDPEDHLYSLRSTAEIPKGPYQSVTCLIHNLTLNVTLNATHILNKGEAATRLSSWTGVLVLVLIPAAVLLSSS